MPIYEYECEACGERFDRLFLSLRQVLAEISCPACHSTVVRRLVSAPAIPPQNSSQWGVRGANPHTGVEETTPAGPPVFGRKELNEALRKKAELRRQIKAAK